MTHKLNNYRLVSTNALRVIQFKLEIWRTWIQMTMAFDGLKHNIPKIAGIQTPSLDYQNGRNLKKEEEVFSPMVGSIKCRILFKAVKSFYFN